MYKAVLDELLETLYLDHSFFTSYNFNELLDLYFCWECGVGADEIKSEQFIIGFDNDENVERLGIFLNKNFNLHEKF